MVVRTTAPLPDTVSPPPPLIEPPRTRFPPLAVVKAWGPAMLKGLLMVSRLVLLSVTGPMRAKGLPTLFALAAEEPSPRMKAGAPGLKVMPETLNVPLVRLLFRFRPLPEEVEKTREPLLLGTTPPSQLALLLKVVSPPPPDQVFVCATAGGTAKRSTAARSRQRTGQVFSAERKRLKGLREPDSIMPATLIAACADKTRNEFLRPMAHLLHG